ncbi:sugar ABC transporter permease [Carnobacterium sp. CS13]|uniref:multiple monosaccharide ABC transporter permease n=1 Tax=Carnobacterium sp. CS13 TaxID=2800128 RepID=UPI0019113652|nr:multiple monosaccharide ABC transporter permease [Carnobacterium sp. CS13]QQP70027.1 sugar ABC transporter permease [Carnobacterium sp. CS13]
MEQTSDEKTLSKENNREKKTIKDIALDILSKYSMIFILIAILIAFQLLTDGILWKPLNITNLILQNSHVLVLAIGMLLVILLGDVDLSVGSVVAFVGAASAVMMVQWQWHPMIAIIASLLVGGLIGAWNGFWISYVGIPAFIVTLAGLLSFRGLTQVILGGTTLAPFPTFFTKLSSGYIPDFIGNGELHLTSILIGLVLSLLSVWNMWKSRKRKKDNLFEVESSAWFITKAAIMFASIMLLTFVLASYQGYPVILILLAVLVMIYGFLTTKTTIGRQIYATGGNRKAAELSGVKTKKLTFWIFVNMGVMAALSGLLVASRLNAATPNAGNGFELDAIAAVYIGGASASGGIGTILGAVIGGLIMGILNNGMSIMGIGIDWQQAIKGLILLLAVAFDIYSRKRKAS